MSTRSELIRRILWPDKKKKLYAAAGGGVGMVGDFSNFVTDDINPSLLILVFSLLAAIAALLCLKNARKIVSLSDKNIQAAAECVYCDAFRLGLVSTAAFLVIMLLGQGQSLTEKVAVRLGLIEEKVATIATDVGEIKTDVGGMKSDVRDIHERTQGFMIIDKPASAADLFNNAWIYSRIRRDTTKGWETMQTMYRDYSPNKIDGAELYFTLGREFFNRSDLLAQMHALGRERKDGTLIVVVGRNAETPEEAAALYAEARKISPDLPFAYWDMRRPKLERSRDSEALLREKQDIDLFLMKSSEQPVSRYFFMPQYQGDFDAIARSTSRTLELMISSRERMEQTTKQQMENFNSTMSAIKGATTAHSKDITRELTKEH